MLLLASLACTSDPGPVTDFSLSISIVTPTNQEPFADLSYVRVRTVDASGEQESDPADVPGAGESAQFGGFAGIDGADVFLEGYSGSSLTTWGRTGPVSIGDSEEGTVSMYVGESQAFGFLTPIEDGRARAGMVAVGGGRFLLAGGSSNRGVTGFADERLWALDLVAPTSLPAFISIGDLPDTENGNGRRVNATFTPITAPGADEGRLLLAGGADGALDASAASVYDVNLYDPATGLWDEDPIASKDQLSTPRAAHVGLGNALGEVIIYGGVNQDGRGIGPVTSVEAYLPAERKFDVLGYAPSDVGVVGMAAADLGQQGTIVCGGATFDDTDHDGYLDQWNPNPGCMRISLANTIEDDVEGLPVAGAPLGLVAASMVSLENGHAVSLGGASATAPLDAESPSYASATRRVFDLDPNSLRWTDHGDVLVLPRAGARAVAISATKILIVGGSAGWNYLSGGNGAYACAELLDTATWTSRAVSTCNVDSESGDLATASSEPTLAFDPEFGALVVGGVGLDAEVQSGVALYQLPLEP